MVCLVQLLPLLLVVTPAGGGHVCSSTECSTGKRGSAARSFTLAASACCCIRAAARAAKAEQLPLLPRDEGSWLNAPLCARPAYAGRQYTALAEEQKWLTCKQCIHEAAQLLLSPRMCNAVGCCKAAARLEGNTYAPWSQDLWCSCCCVKDHLSFSASRSMWGSIMGWLVLAQESPEASDSPERVNLLIHLPVGEYGAKQHVVLRETHIQHEKVM